MKELDEIRQTHKRSIARRAARLAAQAAEKVNGKTTTDEQAAKHVDLSMFM